MQKENNLEQLKKNYEILRKKYAMPSFSEMNEDFDIEKLDGECELLSREIRRAISERNLGYLRFVESFLNPSSAPMFFLALVRSINPEEKATLEGLFPKLAGFELESIRLDNIYNEKKDAEFIKKVYKEWQGIKKEFDIIISSVIDGVEKKSEKKNKGYLG